MVILDLWGISFHPAVVVGLGNDLLFNSILAHCEGLTALYKNSKAFISIRKRGQNDSWKETLLKDNKYK